MPFLPPASGYFFGRNKNMKKVIAVILLCSLVLSGCAAQETERPETPGAVRQRLLCEKAADLLVGTDQSVEEISNRLGFSSSA